MSLHHPPEDLLLSYAGGTLDEATSVLVATHLALCPSCRKAVASAEAVGGALMEDLAPAALQAAGLEAIMTRLDEAPAAPAPKPAVRRGGATRALLPRPLRDYVSGDFDTLPWQWKGVGVHYAPLMKDMSGSRLGLLRVAAGTAVPHHGHSADELTMVLAGGYSNEFGSFLRGDVEYADADIVHQPVADADGPCLCLVITRGRLRPTGLVARALVPFLSF